MLEEQKEGKGVEGVKEGVGEREGERERERRRRRKSRRRRWEESRGGESQGVISG
jgi:hypothetical protein